MYRWWHRCYFLVTFTCGVKLVLHLPYPFCTKLGTCWSVWYLSKMTFGFALSEINQLGLWNIKNEISHHFFPRYCMLSVTAQSWRPANWSTAFKCRTTCGVRWRWLCNWWQKFAQQSFGPIPNSQALLRWCCSIQPKPTQWWSKLSKCLGCWEWTIFRRCYQELHEEVCYS